MPLQTIERNNHELTYIRKNPNSYYIGMIIIDYLLIVQHANMPTIKLLTQNLPTRHKSMPSYNLLYDSAR